jgi:hypothetical protein
MGGDANVKLCFQHFYPRGSAPPRWEICFKKCDRDPHPKPYIFMIRVTRQIKCIIAQAPRVIPHLLPEVNFLMVEIPTPKPYIFMIRVTRQIKCPIAQAPGGHTPPPT